MNISQVIQKLKDNKIKVTIVTVTRKRKIYNKYSYAYNEKTYYIDTMYSNKNATVTQPHLDLIQQVTGINFP